MIFIELSAQTSILEIVFKIATILIAAFNAFFVVKIFSMGNQKNEIEKGRDRKLQLLKTLIFDHNLKYLYSFFDKIELQLINLTDQSITIDKKRAIDSEIGGLFIELRRNFYDLLLSVDNNLYGTINNYADDLQSHLTSTIFDDGINLSHLPKYEELISERVIHTKTDIIKVLFNYNGD